VECFLRVKDKSLPQVDEFRYLGILFTSDGKMEREMDKWNGASLALMVHSDEERAELESEAFD